MKTIPFLLLLLGIVGCSPLRTSPHDERYQWELTLHEVQTNLDDLRHDTNCFQAEMRILEGRIKCFENALASLKQQDLEQQQARIDRLSSQVQAMDKNRIAFEKKQDAERGSLAHLSSHAHETGEALTQFKKRIEELERELLSHNRRLETFGKLKDNIDGLTKTLQGEGNRLYKVRPGDSLEKIAKMHKTDVPTLKQINRLNQDLIVPGQELKLP